MPTVESAAVPNLSFGLPDGTKYACLAASVPFLHLPDAIHFDGLLSIHPGFNAEVPEHWHEWLGSLFADKLAQRNLVIRAAKMSQKPLILDEEHEYLATCTSRFFEALLLFGPRTPSSPILLKSSQI